MQYRHEWKHEINALDRLVLRARLGAVMQPDPYAIAGRYTIRSLYFDDGDDTALREKLDGIARRDKYRIRCYNDDVTHFHLEKKSKIDGLCAKLSCPLTADQLRRILAGDYEWLRDSGQPLLTAFYTRLTAGLRPKTVVAYTREPFVFPAGNVRVTIDYDIRTGLSCTDLLDPDALTVPAGDPAILLEVKWDEFLPDIIRDAVTLPGRRVTAFSKYQQCRIYG